MRGFLAAHNLPMRLMQFLFTIPFWIGASLGALALYLYLFLTNKKLLQLRDRSKRLIEEADKEASEQRRLLLDRAKEDVRRRRQELESDLKRKEQDLKRQELAYQKKADLVKEKELALEIERGKLEERARYLEEKALELRVREEKVEVSAQSLQLQLEKIAHMTRKDAKDALFELLRDEVELENSQWLAKVEEESKIKAKESSVGILCSVMQRYVADQVSFNSSGVIELPSEEIKGKIIGKEGRNIKSLEMATGMEFVIGDTSDTITISGFNPIRREIAKRALTILLQDGRINPTRIEEVVSRCENEVEESIEEVGQKLILEFGFTGVHKEIIKHLGMLQFRTSFSQNVLDHSRETAYFARMIAEELGLNPKIAARCGLFHDIGKALSHDVEGPHAVIGSELLKKCGESSIVVAAVASHHEDMPPSSVYGVITIIADAISAARPGARKETLTAYIKRLEQLEEIAKGFSGVKKAYALQAGREVRIIVDENHLDDSACIKLARDIAKEVVEKMSFPGQIKVNVIRERRCIEYAR